ncbi:MAG: sigma-70 family RNA polymerase sigma factor [Acidobacteria bacterium]|nr:sigma-70 family RNA polymerase sigma factor [Acidobacteriota bacterium]
METRLAAPLFPSISFKEPRPQAAESREYDAAADALRDLPSYLDRVYCLCLGFMGNAADARDLTQDTCVKALASYDRDHPQHVQAWLLCIARNSCLDHMRRRKVRGPLQPISETSAVSWETPEAHAGTVEDIRIMRRAIACLPRRLRDVLVMREYGELTCREIGATLGIGNGTVSKRLKRSRQLVLRYYQEAHTMTEPKGWSDHDQN